jgi:hypothetical protein
LQIYSKLNCSSLSMTHRVAPYEQGAPSKSRSSRATASSSSILVRGSNARAGNGCMIRRCMCIQSKRTAVPAGEGRKVRVPVRPRRDDMRCTRTSYFPRRTQLKYSAKPKHVSFNTVTNVYKYISTFCI